MNVKIRPLQEDDARISVKWRNIPEVWKYTTFEPTREIKIEDELKWMAKILAETDSKRFAILANDKYVGNIYLTNIKNGCGEYHIFIGETGFWGKGIAKEASKLIIEFARKALALQRIELGVNSGNKVAIGLYELLGFKVVGKVGLFTRMALSLGEMMEREI